MSVPPPAGGFDPFAPATEVQQEEAGQTLRRVFDVLAGILELAHSWTGEVTLESGVFYAGVARPECDIRIAAHVWNHPVFRWRTLIHEALHKFSPPFTRREYEQFEGWEEGVVEQLQRLLRRGALDKIGVAAGVPEDALAGAEADHRYNVYIAALESLRALWGEEPEWFYRRLLEIPQPLRFARLMSEADALAEPERTTFRRATLIAHARLSRSSHGA